jgi:hypothetical protein
MTTQHFRIDGFGIYTGTSEAHALAHLWRDAGLAVEYDAEGDVAVATDPSHPGTDGHIVHDRASNRWIIDAGSYLMTTVERELDGLLSLLERRPSRDFAQRYTDVIFGDGVASVDPECVFDLGDVDASLIVGEDNDALVAVFDAGAWTYADAAGNGVEREVWISLAAHLADAEPPR